MRKKLKWLKFFEKTDEEDIFENTNLSKEAIPDKISNFIKNFRFQTGQYKLVCIIRLLLWSLLILIAIYGFAVRIITFIKK